MRQEPKHGALASLLGLKEQENTEAEKALGRKLREPDEPDQAKLAAVWQNIEERIGKSQERPKGKLLHFGLSTRALQISVAAAAVLILAVTVIVRNFAPPRVDLVITVKGIDQPVSLQSAYSYDEGRITAARLRNVGIEYRSIESLTGRIDRAGIHLALKSGKALFNYAPEKDRLPLTISTPHAVYTITGTEFLLLCSSNRDQLLVRHGRVEAKSYRTGQATSVSVNDLYDTSSDILLRRPTNKTEAVVGRFREIDRSMADFERDYADFLRNDRAAARRRVYIELTNGQIFTGEVFSENSESVTLQITASRQKVVVRREEIKSKKDLR